jgi:hypothetical protein
MSRTTRAAPAAASTEPDGSLLHRIVDGVLTEPALALGFNVASHSPHIMAFFDKLEGMIGPVLTGMVITGTGGLVQVKGRLKEILVSKGVPARLVNGFNSLIDEAFEGIWAARMARMARGDRNEQITDADVKAGTKSAKNKFAEAQRLERTKFMSALKNVDPAKRKSFLDKAASITDPGLKKKFDYYRPLLCEEVWMVTEFADLDVADWFTRLELVLGPYEKRGVASVIGKVLKEAGDGLKDLDTEIHEHLGVKDPNNDRVNDMIRGLTQSLKRRRGVY